MPTKYKLIAAVIGSVATYRLITHPLRLKYAELVRTAIALDKHNDELLGQMAYLVNVLNQNEIELDEFDLIVLTHIEA